MEEVRELIKRILKTRGMTQAQLAQTIGADPPTLSRTLTAPIINTQSHWPAILDALDLEIVIQPKKVSP